MARKKLGPLFARERRAAYRAGSGDLGRVALALDQQLAGHAPWRASRL
jgi:hypothetical protein